jgi:hypothetical protein
MRARIARRLVPGAAALAAAVAVVGLVSASSEADSQHGRLDLTSIAIPTAVQPQVHDTAFDLEHLRGPRVDVDTSAAATSDCDGCAAVATTLAIVYADGRSGGRFDNVATAWNTCADCSATTVSVQVVVLRKAGPVTVNNRALALNAACESCHANAAAYQLVVVSRHGRALGRADVARLQSWVAEQAEQLATPAPRMSLRSSAPAAKPLGGLESQLGTALGGVTTVSQSTDVRHG